MKQTYFLTNLPTYSFLHPSVWGWFLWWFFEHIVAHHQRVCPLFSVSHRMQVWTVQKNLVCRDTMSEGLLLSRRAILFCSKWIKIGTRHAGYDANSNVECNPPRSFQTKRKRERAFLAVGGAFTTWFFTSHLMCLTTQTLRLSAIVVLLLPLISSTQPLWLVDMYDLHLGKIGTKSIK